MDIRRRSIVDGRTSFEARRRQSWVEMESVSHAEKLLDDQYQRKVEKLDFYYRKVKENIINYQSPFGLFPSYDAKGSPNVSTVRDNLFCTAAIWSLRQCYQHIDNDGGKTYELGQCAVKCMRAILFCWMQQAESVEEFKKDQRPDLALHSIFTLDGKRIFSPAEYGHLQLGVVSLYLIFLAQMITSGLQIIYSIDEVTFIQQLVFYVERTYRTPDFGFWARGSKYNDHTPELHASSLGASKAALEIMNGFDLYGDQASSSRSVVYVDIDAYNRNRITLNTMLPRESASKNTDAALLFTVGWPVFAIHNSDIVAKTTEKCKRRLEGTYGFKRYLRDGQFTLVEDASREFYRPEELKNFDNVECQWPVFFAQMIIDAIFRGDKHVEEKYMKKLHGFIMYTESGDFMPMFYRVEDIDDERRKPGSTNLMPSDEMERKQPFLFGQAVWLIAQLLHEGLLLKNDLDPMRRHMKPLERPSQYSRYSSIQGFYSDLVVHIIPIAESARLQQLLLTYGIPTQTPKQIEPIKIWSPTQLIRAYSYLGVNDKLKFSGRPERPIGVLGTCKIYRIFSQMVMCYPLTFETVEFYVSHDLSLLLDNVQEDFEFLRRCWKLKGKPVYCFLIREEHIKGHQRVEMLELLSSIKKGKVNNVRVRMERLQTIVPSASIEHLDFMDNIDVTLTFNSMQELNFDHWYYKSLTELSYRECSHRPAMEKLVFEDFSHLNPAQLEEQLDSCYAIRGDDGTWRYCQLLAEAVRRYGLQHSMSIGRKDSPFTLQIHVEKVLEAATDEKNWLIMRYCSGILRAFVNSLAPSITNFIVRGKIVTIGLYGKTEVVINKPAQPKQIFNIIFEQVAAMDPLFSVIVQEMILVLSNFMTVDSDMFDGILKLRLGWVFEAMKLEMDNFTREIQEPVNIYSLSPNELKQLIFYVFTCDENDDRTWLMKRKLDGALGRYPRNLYEQVWGILERVEGIEIAGRKLMQIPTLQDMTDYELNFSLTVEEMLSAIQRPLYRQTVVDVIQVLYSMLSRHKEIYVNQVVNMDEIISCAIKKYMEDMPGATEESFFELEPNLEGGSVSYMIRATIDNLFAGCAKIAKKASNDGNTCRIS